MDSAPVAPATAAADPRLRGLAPLESLALLTASALVLAASHLRLWPIAVAEAWGFVTGGICVWLVVRQHVWNWPIGLANNVFFFVLFFRGRLFADMSLQVVYFGLGAFGWWNWLYGGSGHTTLRISRAARSEWLAAAIPLCTLGLRQVLVAVGGAAPFWDSLTTVLSLAAQYLLSRKRLENWAFWIIADVVYVPLYLGRKLPLTALLYGVFLLMCLVGAREWWRSFRSEGRRA
jgi:nicotinamide mononucleotide transporter